MTGLAIISSFAVCWLALSWLLQRGRLPMDHPNERSLHAIPTPRVGGVAIMAGVLVSVAWIAVIDSGRDAVSLVLAAFALAGVSLLDDVRGLPVVVRLSAHFAAAVACLLVLGLGGWELLLGTFAVVWMTNLYNFMDGADGLAGGMAVIGFGAFALAAWFANAPSIVVLCGGIAAAAMAFLGFNFPPAKVFLGDVGSIPLGFLAAVVGILGVREGLWAWPFPLLVFSPFIVDASLTLLRRALRGERVWRAHRSHYYQKALLMGASRRRLALTSYALMMGGVILAISTLWWPEHTTLFLTLWAATLLVVALVVDRCWKRFRHEH